MRSHLAKNGLPIWAKLALAVGCALIAAQARAGCGDHVKIHPHDPAMDAQTQQSESHHAPNLPSPKLPCSGPNCSGHPGHFPAAPISVQTSEPDQWGWLVMVPMPAASEIGPRIELFTSAISDDHPSRVERPPR